MPGLSIRNKISKLPYADMNKLPSTKAPMGVPVGRYEEESSIGPGSALGSWRDKPVGPQEVADWEQEFQQKGDQVATDEATWEALLFGGGAAKGLAKKGLGKLAERSALKPSRSENLRSLFRSPPSPDTVPGKVSGPSPLDALSDEWIGKNTARQYAEPASVRSLRPPVEKPSTIPVAPRPNPLDKLTPEWVGKNTQKWEVLPKAGESGPVSKRLRLPSAGRQSTLHKGAPSPKALEDSGYGDPLYDNYIVPSYFHGGNIDDLREISPKFGVYDDTFHLRDPKTGNLPPIVGARHALRELLDRRGSDQATINKIRRTQPRFSAPRDPKYDNLLSNLPEDIKQLNPYPRNPEKKFSDPSKELKDYLDNRKYYEDMLGENNTRVRISELQDAVKPKKPTLKSVVQKSKK